jgi:Ca2+-binding RTX toxin-like protein
MDTVKFTDMALSDLTSINKDINNSLYFSFGNAAANVLDAGADTLIGGTVNDLYVVDNIGDSVVEASGEGTDTVQASVSYGLAANIENLTLTGAAAINGTGNSLANTLIGNAAANVLDGGAGADTLIGGLGDDVYLVDNSADTVSEASGEGTDSVQAAVSYTLAANVENLILTGTAALNGAGNSLANSLVGNSADNLLDGGVGADSLQGGLGNDVYVVDNIGDTITENAKEGTDSVQSAVTWTLGANLENLTLTGAAAINGIGNSQANTLLGNAAANTLNGGGGADTLIGGLGDDLYTIDNSGDTVSENSGEGTDTVQSSITYSLGV